MSDMQDLSDMSKDKKQAAISDNVGVGLHRRAARLFTEDV
jgi:hypothetical protein